ncbi:hypothetical protein B0J17DRAFT_756977 [Rhizoctonia solani]|nr:hypothetical protein B0J17DRAFT_756977 [Rhizoctonia solani]
MWVTSVSIGNTRVGLREPKDWSNPSLSPSSKMATVLLLYLGSRLCAVSEQPLLLSPNDCLDAPAAIIPDKKPTVFDILELTVSLDSEISGLQAMNKLTQHGTGETLSGNLPGSFHYGSLGQLISRQCLYPVDEGDQTDMSYIRLKPFSYEYGYLTFKLLVTAANICLLKRWEKLDRVVAKGLRDSANSAGDPLSEYVAEEVKHRLEIFTPSHACQSILDWSNTPDNDRQPPILSPIEATILLDMLWEDRKFFFQVMGFGTLPGLSGIMLGFLAIISQESYSQLGPGGEMRDSMLSDLEKKQHSSLPHIHDQLLKVFSRKDWMKNPKHTDINDSRLIVENIDSRSQDLLPMIIQATLDYSSVILDKIRLDGDEIWLFQSLFGHLFTDNEYDAHEAARETIFGLFQTLVGKVSNSELIKRFRHHFDDWWKIRRHLLMIQHGVLGDMTPLDHERDKMRMKLWSCVAVSLGFETGSAESNGIDRWNKRCPQAYQIQLGQGAKFGCSGCAHAAHCDNRCHIMRVLVEFLKFSRLIHSDLYRDWNFEGHARTHRELNRSFVEFGLQQE